MQVLDTFSSTLFQIKWLFYFFIAMAWASCDRAPDYPDTSDIEVPLSIYRTDQVMNCRDSVECLDSIQVLYEEHNFFAELYLQRILPISPSRDSIEHAGKCALFFSDSLVQEVRDEVQQVFPENKFLESALLPVLQNWSYYFPNEPVPEFYCYYSLFNFGVVVLDDDAMGLGLDFFLGNEYPGYPASRFPNYIQRTMDKKFLPSRVAKGMIQNILPGPASDRLLDQMIYKGKILFLTEKLLPADPDSLIFHYSQKKIDWMKDNELETWAALLKEEMLYSRNEVEYRKLVDPSPSGPSFMPRASPGEAGSWIGWQIVRAFMARHPEKGMMDLVKMTDSQKILDQSRYKPR